MDEKGPSSDKSIEHARLAFEREKWRDEFSLRGRELETKRLDQGRGRWTNPLVIAVFAAAVAALGNAGVAWLTAYEQRQADATKAEQTLAANESKAEADRILESIKTNNDPEKAATNLRFLVETGLIKTKGPLESYLQKRKKGEGPTLPAAGAASQRREDHYGWFEVICRIGKVPEQRRLGLQTELMTFLRRTFGPYKDALKASAEGNVWNVSFSSAPSGKIDYDSNIARFALYSVSLGQKDELVEEITSLMRNAAGTAECAAMRGLGESDRIGEESSK
jgi:hypothetical protein